MILEQMTIANYGPFYGTHELRMRDLGLVFVDGANQDEPWMESNGAGKSSAFEALKWAITGDVPRDDHVDSVVNDLAGRNTSVTLKFWDEERDVALELVRWRKHDEFGTAGVRFLVDGTDVSALDSRETQRLIERELGLDSELFSAAVFFGQTDMYRFADAKDKERMDVLTKILQLEQVDEWLATVKDLHSRLQSLATLRQNELALAERDLATLRAQDHTRLFADFESKRTLSVGRVEQYAASLQETLTKIQAEQAQLPDLPQLQAAASEYTKAIANAQTTIGQLRAQLSGIAQRRRDAEAAIAAIRGLQGTQCPTCKQAVGPEHATAVAGGLQGILESEAAQLQTYQASMAQWEQYLREVEVGRAKASSEEQRAGQVARDAAEVSRNLERARAELQQERTRANPYADAVRNHEAKLTEAQWAVEAAKEVVAQSVKDLAYYDFWVKGLGKAGLKNYILDARIQELNEAINEWVGILTQGAIRVELDPQTQNRKGDLSNKIDLRVIRTNRDGTTTTRNYRSWSGGEKRRVALAIDFGLSRIIARRAKQRYNFMVLDEIFRHLDGAGREACMDLLKALAKEKSTIFAIDHDAEFAALFQTRMCVTRRDLQSKIEFHGRAAA